MAVLTESLVSSIQGCGCIVPETIEGVQLELLCRMHTAILKCSSVHATRQATGDANNQAGTRNLDNACKKYNLYSKGVHMPGYQVPIECTSPSQIWLALWL